MNPARIVRVRASFGLHHLVHVGFARHWCGTRGCLRGLVAAGEDVELCGLRTAW
jgi:hypothetical protein